MRQRDLEQPGWVIRVLRHHDGAAANEDQRERADEFGDEVFSQGKVRGQRSKLRCPQAGNLTAIRKRPPASVSTSPGTLPSASASQATH